MKYDISKQTAPKMPRLGKGTECVKILLSQVSKDMHAPLIPMLFPILAAHVSGSEFQYPDLTWKELCGQMANLIAESGGNKGQLSLLVEAICRDFRQHDEAELKKLVEWLVYHDIWSKVRGVGLLLWRYLNLKNSATEHVSLPYRALLPTIQSMPLYTYRACLCILRNTAL